MTTFLSFLILALFIALIVGLVKPQLVLPWTTKPSRIKVLSYWILATFFVGILIVATEKPEDLAKSNIEAAQKHINQGDYSAAIARLKRINKDNTLYPEAQKLIQKIDSLRKIEEKKTLEENRSKQIEQLKREISSINHGIDFSTYRGTIESLQMELILFGAWATMIKEGEKSDDPEIQKLAKQLKEKVTKLQIKEFPVLRKEYAKILAQKLWENDIEVYTSGRKNTYINFIGGIFITNKNKKDFQLQLHETLKMFRFNQSRYKWYKGDDEYTYWIIYEGKDSDLVFFDK